jgi:hypothetical protein
MDRREVVSAQSRVQSFGGPAHTHCAVKIRCYLSNSDFHPLRLSVRSCRLYCSAHREGGQCLMHVILQLQLAQNAKAIGNSKLNRCESFLELHEWTWAGIVPLQMFRLRWIWQISFSGAGEKVWLSQLFAWPLISPFLYLLNGMSKSNQHMTLLFPRM